MVVSFQAAFTCKSWNATRIFYKKAPLCCSIILHKSM